MGTAAAAHGPPYNGKGRLVDFLTREAAAGHPPPETVRRLTQAVLAHQRGVLRDDASLLLASWNHHPMPDTRPTYGGAADTRPALHCEDELSSPGSESQHDQPTGVGRSCVTDPGLRERIRQVRRRLVSDGPPLTRTPDDDFRRVSVPPRDCDLLRDLLVAERAGTVVEIGLAYGASALAIGEALVEVGAHQPRHVIVDPLQKAAWADVGWQLLRSAGLDAIAQLIELPSSVALPRLIDDGVVADAAFVDGSHRFHEVFLDLYFLRKIVRPGGLIVVDDHCWPSVGTAVRYFEKNMGWRPVPGAFAGGSTDQASGEPRVRALRLPDPPFEPAFEDFQPFQ